MLRGDQIVLRARAESDVAVLHSELYDDVATRSRADSRPWKPMSAGSVASPYAVTEPNNETACFSVAEIATDELVGEALLWGIDTHSRAANVGISLRPSFRGRGFGTEVVRVLCRYGFTTRGLHRLQLDTLADNAAMRAVAVRVGFRAEGVLREAAWVDGRFVDSMVFGLLVTESDPHVANPSEDQRLGDAPVARTSL